MPLNRMTFEDRGKETHCDTCKANGVVIGQAPGTGLVNEAAAHNGYPAPTARISKGTPAGIPNGTKPQYMVNGYINHGYKGRSSKAAPPRTFRKQGSMISAVTYPSAAGGVSSRDGSRCSSVNGAASLDTVALPNDSGQMTPESAPSAAVTMQRRKKKKCRHKERDAEVVCPEDFAVEEDWESEACEIKLIDWENLSFGVAPYGPEDVLHFALRNLTLKQTDTVPPQVTANYSPAAHHPRPVQWSCFKLPTVPDQFADADE